MEKIHQRIAKLLALSESDNIHEAANALAQAQALMDKYKIEKIMNNETSRGEVQFSDHLPCFEFNQRVPKWKWSLLWGISKVNNCKPWANRMSSPSTAYLVGFEEDVVHATTMYKYIESKIIGLANRYGLAHPGRSARDSFRKGAVAEVKLRLLEQRDLTMKELKQGAKDSKTKTAIQVIHETSLLVEQAMLNNNMGYRSASSSRSGDAGAFAAGVRAGKSIRLKGNNKELGN
jgi:hypothetical protein